MKEQHKLEKGKKLRLFFVLAGVTCSSPEKGRSSAAWRIMEELQLAVDVDEEMGCSCCPATWRRGSSRSGARGSSRLVARHHAGLVAAAAAGGAAAGRGRGRMPGPRLRT